MTDAHIDPDRAQFAAFKGLDRDRPIDMLIDCHRRIEHFLDVLIRVVDRYAGHALDDEGRQADLAAGETDLDHAAPVLGLAVTGGTALALALLCWSWIKSGFRLKP